MKWANPSVVFAGLALACACETFDRAHAQTFAPPHDGAGRINLGGRGWSGPEPARETVKSETGPFEISAKFGIASDYIYRGTTLSARKPAVGAGVEATYGLFYTGFTAATVNLPTEPSAEYSFSGGIRPSLGNFDFDLGVIYFAYPGEMPGSPGINYYEASFRTDINLGERWRAAGGFAYSPDVSNTGAWGWYAAAGIGYQVPAERIPLNIDVIFSAAAGYSWFGNQSLALGGIELPAYLNWQAGVTFTHKILNLDLRYHDTNLSKENCFVFTGDPGARPGGRVDPVTNPGGMTSRWCSSALVAKLWFEFN
jgi:uncharacterized protein (TIGR02001 family)